MPNTEVVKIACDWTVDGFLIINADEFDPATMKLYEEPKAEAPKGKAKEPKEK